MSDIAAILGIRDHYVDNFLGHPQQLPLRSVHVYPASLTCSGNRTYTPGAGTRTVKPPLACYDMLAFPKDRKYAHMEYGLSILSIEIMGLGGCLVFGY